jgi:hypothetical protein
MIVNTPLGIIRTKERELNEEEWEQSTESMKLINQLTYLELDTEDGIIFMAEGMIQSSIFILVK